MKIPFVHRRYEGCPFGPGLNYGWISGPLLGVAIYGPANAYCTHLRLVLSCRCGEKNRFGNRRLRPHVHLRADADTWNYVAEEQKWVEIRRQIAETS